MKNAFFILLLLILFYFSFMLYPQNSNGEPETIEKVDILLVILIVGLSILSIFITIIIIMLIKILQERKRDMIILNGLGMEERRKHLRDFTPTEVRVKQKLPDGGYKILKFKNRNISKGGVFIITENLSLFDLGEELDIHIKDGQKNFFKGKAIVIHSEAIFNKDSVKTESGYGVMFLSSL